MQEERGVLSFKGTDHYRRKVALFEDGQKDWIPRISGEWVARHYTVDVKKLCDHIELLEAAADTARALILAHEGVQRRGIDLVGESEFKPLRDALGTLEEESG